MQQYPTEHLLKSVEEIAAIQDGLTLVDRSLVNIRGIHISKQSFPGGETEYSVGGQLKTRLVFTRKTDGSWGVSKYQAGDWEYKVEETLELARTLKRACEKIKDWPPEKTKIYQAGETIKKDLVDRVAEVNMEHDAENHEQWRLYGLPRWMELRDKCLYELEREWPIEFVELMINKKDEAKINDILKTHISKAYITGFMYGKGWIGPEEMTQATMHLGEAMARKVSQGLKGAKSKGIAFADVLAHIAVAGTVDGSGAVGKR
jgi:hypothetical protein